MRFVTIDEKKSSLIAGIKEVYSQLQNSIESIQPLPERPGPNFSKKIILLLVG